jgi:PAS domain S-box-containing protein
MSTAAPAGEFQPLDPTLAAAIDSLDESFLLFDADDRLVLTNAAARSLFPHLADRMLSGVRFVELVNLDAAAKHANGEIEDAERWVTERMRMHGQPVARFDARQADGRWLRTLDRATGDGGRIVIARDITDEKRHVEDAARYTALLRGTLENISQGLSAFDPEFRLMTWNARFFELLDLPHTFAQVGTPLVDLVRFLAKRGDHGPGDVAAVTEEVFAMLSQTKGATYVRQNNRGRMLEVRIRPLNGGGIVATYSDVTERHEAENALRESEERYALAAAGANDGLWDWDLGSNRIFLSDRWKEMLGYAAEEIGDGAEEWFSRIHPEDVQRVTAQIDAHLSGTATSFESEHRVRHIDDTYRWMLVRGLAVRDAQNNAYRIAGSMTDVTERKRSEEQAIHDALHDSLTGLANRTLYLERVRQALPKCSPMTKAAARLKLNQPMRYRIKVMAISALDDCNM